MAAVTAARAEKTTDAAGHAHVGKMHLNKAIAKQGAEEADDGPRRRAAGPGHRPAVAEAGAEPRPRGQRRRGAKLTVVQALDSETSERMRSVAAFRRRTEKEKRALMQDQRAAEDRARSDAAGSDHRSGAGEPHGGTRRRRDQVSDETWA